METEEREVLTEFTVDLSKQMLKKIERANNGQREAAILILNDNEIQRLDNLDSYSILKKLYLANNQVIRMHGVLQLIHLEVLDLTNNSLVTIEGLKDLKNLKELYLAKNKIKVIEHLNNNLELEKIDISDNNITHISDISYLMNLKELYLHGNKLTHLRQCEKNLPENLEVWTLHNNLISDLNEVSHLVHFNSIKELSFADNPCVNFMDDQNTFNYRPFIKNWCSSLVILDSRPLDDIECLKAEWLYSQGRGRSFRPGEQAALVDYLSNVCPVKEPNDETEDVKKLKLILSKAQQHQKQLREQLSTGNLGVQNSYRASRRKKLFGTPERMAASCHDSPSRDRKKSPDLMTRSLDSHTIKKTCSSKGRKDDSDETPLRTSTTFIPIPDTLISPDVCHGSIPFSSSRPRPSSLSSRTSRSSSRNSPRSTPESKRKTSAVSTRKQNEKCSPVPMKKQEKLINSHSSTTPVRSKTSQNLSPLLSGRVSSSKEVERNYRGTSEEEDSENFGRKFSGTPRKAIPKRLSRKRFDQVHPRDHPGSKKDSKEESEGQNWMDARAWKAAVCIQRRWRGYRARNLNGEVLTACKDIQLSRMQDYITKVVDEVEAARIALESNRKLQVLQMQAINALWKKMIAFRGSEPMENSNESKAVLQELIATCSNLNKQVEGLQVMMKTMRNSSGSIDSAPMSTQTEIVAVHTPQGEGKKVFPYVPKSGIFPTGNRSSFADRENGSQEEVENFVPQKETDVTEIFTNKNLESISPSDREIFAIPKYQREKVEEKESSTKSLMDPNDHSSDFPGLRIKEDDLFVDRSEKTDESQRGCDS